MVKKNGVLGSGVSPFLSLFSYFILLSFFSFFLFNGSARKRIFISRISLSLMVKKSLILFNILNLNYEINTFYFIECTRNQENT